MRKSEDWGGGSDPLWKISITKQHFFFRGFPKLTFSSLAFIHFEKLGETVSWARIQFPVWEIAILSMDFKLVTRFSGYVPGPEKNMKKKSFYGVTKTPCRIRDMCILTKGSPVPPPFCYQQIIRWYFWYQPIIRQYFCYQQIIFRYFCYQLIICRYFCYQLIIRRYFCY